MRVLNIIKSIFFITLILFLVSITLSAYAQPGKLKVTAIGPVIKDNNGLSQNISINFISKSNWSITALTFDNYLQNSLNSAKSLPVNRIRIIDTETSQEYIMEKGKSVIIKSGTEKGNLDKRFQIKMITDNGDYPGIYTATVQFVVESSLNTDTEAFSVSFDKESIQSLNILPASLSYTVAPDNLLKTSQTLKINQPTKILIKSNTSWKLILKGQPNSAAVQEFKVSSLPQGALTSYAGDFYPVSTSDVVIAQGQPTIGVNNSLEFRTIQLEYRFITGEDLIPSGIYPVSMQYRLVPADIGTSLNE